MRKVEKGLSFHFLPGFESLTTPRSADYTIAFLAILLTGEKHEISTVEFYEDQASKHVLTIAFELHSIMSGDFSFY